MSRVSQIAELLDGALRARKPIAPITSAVSDLTLQEAYGIQTELAKKRVARGETPTGYKVGLTSKTAQRHFGIEEPDFGRLFTSMQVADGGVLRLRELIQPRAEAELVFKMGKDLRTANPSVREIENAIHSVHIGIEIIDSRIQDWKIRALDTISDNGSSAKFAVGAQGISVHNFDLGTVGIGLSINGEWVSSGAGAAVLGNPIQAITFLAQEIAKSGEYLKAGDWVFSGAVTGMFPLRAGDRVVAEGYRLGRVAFRCEE